MKYFLDLFSGIGGFHLGAQWAGLHFDGYYYSEVDPYAIKVYAKRFPDAVGLGDITKIDGHDLPQGEWIIAGGFPCQDISIAGKGAGLAGERSGLWYEYARLIGELRPRFAIMENVGALTFRGLDAVLGSLAEIGYDAEWQDIRASDVGAPHRRERIWIVAYPNIMRESRGTESREQLERAAQFERGCSIGMEAGPDVAHADSERLEKHRMFDAMLSFRSSETGASTESTKTNVADSTGTGLQVGGQPGQPEGDTETRTRMEQESERCSQAVADSQDGWNVRRDGELEPTKKQVREYRGSPQDGCREWWTTEPALGCVVDGLPSGLDRFEGRVCNKMPERVNQLKCLGNSIVPQIAQLIFEQPAFDEWRHR